MEGLLRKKNVTMGLIGILSMLMGIFFVSFCVHDTEEYARNRMVENQLFSWGVLSNRNIVTYVNSQGMDIYDDKYLFQGSTSKLKTGNFKKANIITVDIINRKILGQIDLTNEEFHTNNINIGDKYDDTDKFPMLYVSESYFPHRCIVIRLSNDAQSFEKVQTLSYQGTYYQNVDYQDWFLGYDGYIYALGSISHTVVTNGRVKILKFVMPDINDGDVVLSDTDIIDSYDLDLLVFQGQKVINGRLFLPYGFGTKQYPAGIAVFDFEKRAITNRVTDYYGEPEGIAFFDHRLIVVDNSSEPVYSIYPLFY